MKKIIKIGTRKSELALWQAKKVAQLLQEKGYQSELVEISSKGDLQLNKAIYELGITGVFTKSLDNALLNKTIDIAVHSMKDVPTLLPKGITQLAVLERGLIGDVFVPKEGNSIYEKGIVATGSLRRKAQWLRKFPNYKVVDLRGNVNLRLEKLKNSNWNGAIFAQAGLDRINLLPKNAIHLDWMIPAPAQGAVVVAGLQENKFVQEACHLLNHQKTAICTKIERDFMQTMESGCTAPIGGIAHIEDNTIYFKGALFSLDGKTIFKIEKQATLSESKNMGVDAGKELIAQGADQLIKTIKLTLEKNSGK